jgi:hypothetical protein
MIKSVVVLVATSCGAREIRTETEIRYLIEEGFPSPAARAMVAESMNGPAIERMLEQVRRLDGESYARVIDALVAEGVPKRMAEAMLAENRGEGTERQPMSRRPKHLR